MAKNLILWLIIAAVLVTVMNNFSSPNEPQTLNYSDFIQQVKDGKVERVAVDGYVITGKRNDGDSFKTIRPAIQDNGLIGDLVNNHVVVEGKQPEQQSIWTQLLVASFPILVIIAVFMFFMRQMQGGAGGKGGPMSFGKSKARLLSEAIAGEAKVPFFTISGSDFVEMFVGVGASRVRDMFEQAKKHAPCIIFIDEIDAVGRHRGAGLGGGHDEREQTLNQLLVEMDGFEGNEGVIVIAATNRPDVLDPALLRPGRFDRQVVVPLPNLRGREQILKVHMRKVPMGEDVNPAVIARGTPGFSGADVAKLVNEESRFAARTGKRIVEMKEFELAKDKIMMGAERKSMVMSEKEKQNTAYHEAGNAIVGRVVPEHDPVYKVSSIPRGRALGVTMFLPEEDRYSLSKRAVISQICSLYGGRIAEEMTLGFDGVTTGASNDIMRASQIARNMVTKWGLSEKLGPLMYAEEEGEVFLGRGGGGQSASFSGETAKLIDSEVRSIIDQCYGTAKQILTDNRDKLDAMADALMKYETIDADQIDDIMAGRTPREPRDWEGGSGTSGTPPVVQNERPEAPIGGPAADH